jgi:hypothetical protein
MIAATMIQVTKHFAHKRGLGFIPGVPPVSPPGPVRGTPCELPAQHPDIIPPYLLPILTNAKMPTTIAITTAIRTNELELPFRIERAPLGELTGAFNVGLTAAVALEVKLPSSSAATVCPS